MRDETAIVFDIGITQEQSKKTDIKK